MDCSELHNPPILIATFKEENENVVNRALACFFNLFYDKFKGLARKYCVARSYTRHREEELAEDAFNKGLLSFYQKIRKDGFEEKGAKVETAFFAFCLMHLKGGVKTVERESGRQSGSDPHVILERKGNEEGETLVILEEETDPMDANKDMFRKGFSMLQERCQNLLSWKKLQKLNNEEIASRLGIDAGSVNNEVYRCFKKLKEIIERLLKDK